MRFYTVNEDYIKFLQNFEGKVPNPGGGSYKNSKTYVGIVLEVDGHKFLAPLTSYKPQHDSWDSSSPTLFKLHEHGNPGNKLGHIALRFMIPVLDSVIVELDVEVQEAKYKQMLQRQHTFIRANKAQIEQRAAKLYGHLVHKKTEHFVKLSCDIPKLLAEYANFKQETADQE